MIVFEAVPRVSLSPQSGERVLSREAARRVRGELLSLGNRPSPGSHLAWLDARHPLPAKAGRGKACSRLR